VYWPGPILAQSMPLPAAEAAAPAAAVILEKSVVEYKMVHCKPAGSLPDVDATFRGSVTVEFRVAEADNRLREMPCPKAGIPAGTRTRITLKMVVLKDICLQPMRHTCIGTKSLLRCVGKYVRLARRRRTLIP